MAPKILTIDDASSIRKMIEIALKSKGYTVSAAADGQEGLEMLERGEHFDAIVLDINMPRMDGLSLLKALRAKPAWAHLPVLMLTTEGQDSDREQALALGASDYMVKPFRPTELIERVEKLLRR
jgi:two-component system, chemotaxis family, chemotaxis protein CheY